MASSQQACLPAPSETSAKLHIEIACDESGFSGGNLVGRGHSPVFAHASIRIEPDAAAELIRDLRQQIGARGEGEYKAAEILRPRRRPALLWLLGPSSPIRGNAYVHLTDTRFFVLARLIEDDRLHRLASWEAVSGPKNVYGPVEMMDDVRKGIWSELSGTGSIVIDPDRRQLQQAYITLLGAKLAPTATTPADVKPVVRGALMDTRAAVLAALTHTTDRETKLHLLDAKETLQLILFPKGA